MLTLLDVTDDVLYLSAKELIIGAAGLVLSTLILVPELTDETIVGLFNISATPLVAFQSLLTCDGGIVGLLRISDTPLVEFQSEFTCGGTSPIVMNPLSLVKSLVNVGIVGLFNISLNPLEEFQSELTCAAGIVGLFNI